MEATRGYESDGRKPQHLDVVFLKEEGVRRFVFFWEMMCFFQKPTVVFWVSFLTYRCLVLQGQGRVLNLPAKVSKQIKGGNA